MDETDKNGAYVTTNKKDLAPIAAIAQMFTAQMMELAADMDGKVNWQELCFACGVAMKGIAEVQAQMTSRPRDEALQELREVFEDAMSQKVVPMMFKSREAAEQWMREQGIEPGEIPVPVALIPKTRY